jgi:carbonic anhydrase/acetyltransferase-like protein (isoleucine patch superfamily)
MRSGSRGIRFNDPLWFFPRALTKLYSTWVRLMYPFASLGRKVSFHYTCDLRNTGLMEVGDYVSVHEHVWLHTRALDSTSTEPALVIRDHCFIGRRSHISAKNRIEIERNVLIAASVLIEDHSHAYDDLAKPIRDQGATDGGRIRIGEGSWIGQGAVIFSPAGELTLGRNCVVAANAVVTRSAPAYSVLSGNPARVVKQFDAARGAWVLGASASAH